MLKGSLIAILIAAPAVAQAHVVVETRVYDCQGDRASLDLHWFTHGDKSHLLRCEATLAGIDHNPDATHVSLPSCDAQTDNQAVRSLGLTFDARHHIVTARGYECNLSEIIADDTPDSCQERLITMHEDWDPAEVDVACYGAHSECVVSLAGAQPEFRGGDLNMACRYDINNCAGRLAPMHLDWDAGELSVACFGADAQCVLDRAAEMPAAVPGDLNFMCRD